MGWVGVGEKIMSFNLDVLHLHNLKDIFYESEELEKDVDWRYRFVIEVLLGKLHLFSNTLLTLSPKHPTTLPFLSYLFHQIFSRLLEPSLLYLYS